MNIRILEPNAELPNGSILVPWSLHDADTDTALLLYAAELAVKQQKRLLVMHTVHEPADQPGMYLKLASADTVKPMALIAESLCATRLEALQQAHAGVRALQQLDLYLIPGLPENRIVEVAERARCSMIIIARHRSTPHDHLFSSSTTESVLYHAKCTVELLALEPAVEERALKPTADPQNASRQGGQPLAQRHT